MKKLFLTSLMLLAGMFTMKAEQVSRQEALQIARQFMPGKQFVETKSQSRSSSGSGSDAFYIFNAEDKNGFVIVSGDDRMPEILGYSDKGTLNPETAPCNVKWLLDSYRKASEDIRQPITQTRGAENVSKPAILPLMTMTWSQGSPYNAMCPEYNGTQCLTGCVATAMAQVIGYNRWPIGQTNVVDGYVSGLSIQVIPLSPTQFDWDSMTNDDIARLMRYCGQSVMTNYGLGSDAQPEAVPNALVDVFGYSQTAHYVKHAFYDETEWENLIYNELAEQRPVIYDGYAGSLGHAFVIHGYDAGRFYINWGWNGDEDGYFLLTGLNTSAGTFGSDQGATIGICPPTNNDRPKVVVKSISSTNTKYTPRDDDGNISDNQVSCTLTSDLSEQKTMQIGLAMYSDETFLKILSWENHDFSVGETYQYNATFNLENTANGTYRIMAVWRNSESDSWQTDANASENYLEITLDDERMRMRTFPMSMDERLTEEVVVTIDGLTYCLKTVNSLRLATVMNEKKHKPSGDVYIPDDVEYNGVQYHVYDAEYEAFDNCPNLTSLSTSMTRFHGLNSCKNLIRLELREGVTFMDSGVEGCQKLESIELPKSLVYVSQVSASSTIKTIRFKNPNSFEYQMSFGYPEEWITALTDIYFASPFAPKLDLRAIDGTFPVNSHVTIHVPQGAKANYEAGGWKGWNIVEDQQLPTEQSIECGYSTSNETARFFYLNDNGNNSSEYAIRVLPEMLSSFVGKTINRIRFWSDTDIDYVFISSPESDYIVKQPVTGLVNATWHEAFLSEPYTITGDPLYIGIGANPPHLGGAAPAIYEDPTDEGYWYRAVGTDTSNDMKPGVWKNQAENQFYRPLPIRFFVSSSGEDLLYDLALNKVAVVSEGGGHYSFKAKVTNRSPKTIKSYTVTWDIDGVVKGEKTFQTSLANGLFETIEFGATAELNGKNHYFNYTISSVDGQPDGYAANSSGTVSFIAAKTVFPRKAVMEVAIPAGEAFYARVAEVVDPLINKYPNNFIPVGLYGIDVMTPENYNPIMDKFPLVPNSLVNRIYITDGMPYDLVVDVFSRLNLSAVAQITPSATFTAADSSSVAVTTESLFGFSDTEGSAYRIAYVIMEDNVVGSCMQADTDSPEEKMLYNNVARSIVGGINGVEGSVPSIIKEGDTYKYTYCFRLPDNIQSKKNVSIVTLLIDDTNGEIVNAERTPIEGVKIYDANGDDKVDDQDIVDVTNDILGNPTSTGTFDKSAADVNNDGVVNALDIVLMIKILNSH